MRGDAERSPGAARRDRITTYRRSAGLAVLAAAAALALAACGGSKSPAVASIGTTNTLTTATGNRSAGTGRRTSTIAVAKGNPTRSLADWAACMRRHGDPNQTDPTIDAHGVISVFIPSDSASLSNAVHNGTAPCNEYLAAASAALRAATPTAAPPDQAQLVQYSQCMRANGVPNYPDPGTGGTTNFQGTGIDPNSPFFQRANNVCGKKIRAPSWWISGTGPPGDITVQSGFAGAGTPRSPERGASTTSVPAVGTRASTTGGG